MLVERPVRSLWASQSLSLTQSVLVTGAHRCSKVGLVVVTDLSALHDAEAACRDSDQAISLVYVVALGLDVTTEAQLVGVQGRAGRLAVHSCVRHVPAMKKKVVFAIDAQFQIEQADVVSALRRISRTHRGPKLSLFSLPTQPLAGLFRVVCAMS